MHSKAGFSIPQNVEHKSNSEPLLGPFMGVPKSKVRADYDEPSNEELGIVPVRGWRRLLVWLAPYALIALAWAGYTAIAWQMGWLK